MWLNHWAWAFYFIESYGQILILSFSILGNHMWALLAHLLPLVINTSLLPFIFAIMKFVLIKALVLGKVALFLALKLLFKKEKDHPPSIMKIEYRNPPSEYQQSAYIVYPSQQPSGGDQHHESQSVPPTFMMDTHQQPFGINMGDFAGYVRRSSKSDKMETKPMKLKPKSRRKKWITDN